MKIHAREALNSDLALVRELAVESLVHGIPHTREIDPAVVKSRAEAVLKDLPLWLKYRPGFKLLVAYEEESGDFVGYLMLLLNEEEESTGEKQALVQDIALAKKYWGRYSYRPLMYKAEEIAKEHGLQYITCRISDKNKRALIPTQRDLGYVIERHQLVKKLV